MNSKISDIKSSCGCTVPTGWSRSPLMPNESAEFTVNLDGKGANKVTKTITLTTNTKKGKEIVMAGATGTLKHAEAQKEAHFESLDDTSKEIINILEEYVKPAVASDGGNIQFISYDATSKKVSVMLQGACSGCPSSTYTLKSGIENMLKDMLNDNEIVVEALNG